MRSARGACREGPKVGRGERDWDTKADRIFVLFTCVCSASAPQPGRRAPGTFAMEDGQQWVRNTGSTLPLNKWREMPSALQQEAEKSIYDDYCYSLLTAYHVPDTVLSIF